MTTTIVPAVLQPGVALGTSEATVIAAAANTTCIIRRAVVANPTSGPVMVTVTRIPNGGGALVIVPTRSVAATGTDLLPELTNMVLNQGDVIQAMASAAASMNFFASGFTQ